MRTYIWSGATILLTLLIVFTITILDDRITVEFPSDQCPKGLTLIVHDDYTKLKCGYNVVAEWNEYVDYYRTYGEPDRWVNNFRKRTLIKLSVLDYSPDYFVIRKEVPYYKGRTGTDGILYIDYTFTKHKIKWSYTFNHTNTASHRIRLKMLRFEEKYGYDFLPTDDLFYDMVDNEYYYGNVKGNLFIDPEIKEKNKIYIDKECIVNSIIEYYQEPIYEMEHKEYPENGTSTDYLVLVGYTNKSKVKNIVKCKRYLEHRGVKVDFLKQGYNCLGDKEIICDSCIDGNCDGICSPNGGETCCRVNTGVCKNGVVDWNDKSLLLPVKKLEVR